MGQTWISLTYGGLLAIAISDFVLVTLHGLFRKGEAGLRLRAFVMFPMATFLASLFGSESAKWAYDAIYRTVSYSPIGQGGLLPDEWIWLIGYWFVARNFFISTILIVLLVSISIYADLYISYGRKTAPKS